jgi:hypothetical protein
MKDDLQCRGCKGTMDLSDGLEESMHGLCHPCASGALDEALEVLAPFAFHAKALGANKAKGQLKVVSKVRSSYLVLGAFKEALVFFKKHTQR